MEAEQSQNFNERLSQWVASQGFWFQLRYSLSGSGSKGTAMFHLLRMMFRLMVFLLIVAVGFWFYLVKRTESKAFTEGLKNELKAGLTASDIEVSGFSRSQGEMVIGALAAQGGNNTFFSSLEARNIRSRMGLLDGIHGEWDTGVVSMSRMEVDLRAGADDADSAKQMAESVFRKFRNVRLSSLEVTDASVRWGYSERTKGSISNSALQVQRLDGNLKLRFRGGTFSQNWLRSLEIVDLVISCDPDGLVFEKALLKKGAGTLDFSGLKVTGGERPVLEGSMKIHKLDVEGLLQPLQQSFVEGSFSGDFRVSGSTNTTDGVGFSGQVTLEAGDILTLRKRVHLLQALSDVDYVRNYHRVDFNEGSFQMKTSGGGMEISNLTLKSGDLLTLEGKMRVRLPTPEEAQSTMGNGGDGYNTAGGGRSPDEGSSPEEADFSLRRAGQEAQRVKDGKQTEGPPSLSQKLELNLELRRLEEQAAERVSRTLRYEGLFRITLPPDAFERAPKLTERFPVDQTTKRIPLMVPIEGELVDITLKQAEEIYQLRSR
ncbi:MAG: hypothetical protein EOP88_04255 [Verrucomicrobiaceae bacterium]|nr:MAG: hypothetical protein EOP88_04255 [Verrucomicrobiaceae bacterium]